MCFRPGEAMQAINCPECGTINPGVAKTCRSCGADFEAYKEELERKKAAGEEAPMARVTPPTAPRQPAAPGAPSAPTAPGRPAVPKATGVS